MSPKESGRVHLVNESRTSRIILYLPAFAEQGTELATVFRELIVALKQFPPDAHSAITNSLGIVINERKWWVKPSHRGRKMLIALLERLFPLHLGVVQQVRSEIEGDPNWRSSVASIVESLSRAEVLRQAEALSHNATARKLAHEIVGRTPESAIVQTAQQICQSLREKLTAGELSAEDRNDLQIATDPDAVERWAKKQMIRSMRVVQTRECKSPLTHLQKEFIELATAAIADAPATIQEYLGSEVAQNRTGDQTIHIIVMQIMANAPHVHVRLESLLWRFAYWKVDRFSAEWAGLMIVDERLISHLRQMQSAALRVAKAGVIEYSRERAVEARNDE